MKSGKQRNLNLTQRKLNTRDKIQPEVVKFSLDEIKKHFEDSISDIEAQVLHLLSQMKTVKTG